MTARQRSPGVTGGRLLRGAVGGVVAGIPFIVLTMWFTSTTGGGWLAPLELISTIVLGADALRSGTARPEVGAVVHLLVSAGTGTGFAVLSAALRSNGAVAVAGAAYGVLVYVLDFVVVGRTLLPQFATANQPFELVAHVVYGVVLSFVLYRPGWSGRPPAPGAESGP